MRARNIKPGFFKNEKLADCSLAARLLFAGLWMLADREGRLEDRPKRIEGEIFPYEDFDTNSLLNELAEHGFILRYELGGGKYIQVINFIKHQNPHKNETASVIPSVYRATQEITGTTPADCLIMNPYPDSIIPESITLPTDAEQIDRKFQKPTIEEVSAYCLQRRNNVDAEAFVAFYESKGWMVGKNKMMDWKSAVITWEKNSSKNKANPSRLSQKNMSLDEYIAGFTGDDPLQISETFGGVKI